MAATEGGVGAQGTRADGSRRGPGGRPFEGRARGRRRAGWQGGMWKGEEEAGGEERRGRPGPWDPPSCPAQDPGSGWNTPWRPWRSECVHLPPQAGRLRSFQWCTG